MSNRYFTLFPMMVYANVVCTDITRRVALVDGFKNSLSAYYPYTLKPGDRPDTIGQGYYGDQDLAWLAYFSNKTYDPYYDWPIDDPSFAEFITNKYGSAQAAQQLILFWEVKFIDAGNPFLSGAAYDALPEPLKKYYVPNFGEGAQILSYNRRQQSVQTSTNMIVTWGIANTANSFQRGEVVSLEQGPVTWSNAYVSFTNSSVAIVQHVVGDITANGGITSCVLVGANSGATANVTSFAFTQNCIPIDETVFWGPAFAWDVEVAKNQANRYVQLIDSKFSTGIVTTVKQELAE